MWVPFTLSTVYTKTISPAILCPVHEIVDLFALFSVPFHSSAISICSMLAFARVRAYLTYSRSINFLFHDNERRKEKKQKQTKNVMRERMLDVMSSNLPIRQSTADRSIRRLLSRVTYRDCFFRPDFNWKSKIYIRAWRTKSALEPWKVDRKEPPANKFRPAYFVTRRFFFFFCRASRRCRFQFKLIRIRRTQSFEMRSYVKWICAICCGVAAKIKRRCVRSAFAAENAKNKFSEFRREGPRRADAIKMSEYIETH